MKRIDAKFLIMGLVLLLAGLIFGRILILVAGVALLVVGLYNYLFDRKLLANKLSKGKDE